MKKELTLEEYRYREFYELCQELEKNGKEFDKETLKLLSYKDLPLAGIGNAGKAACDYQLIEEEMKIRMDSVIGFSFEDIEKDKGKWKLLDDNGMYWEYYKSKSTPLKISDVPLWRLLVKHMVDLRGNWSSGRDNEHLKLIYKLLPGVRKEGLIPDGWIDAVKENADDFDGEFNDGRIMRDGLLRLPKEVADEFHFPNTNASGNLAKILGAKEQVRAGGYKGSYTELFENILSPEDKVIFVSELIEDDDIRLMRI